MTSIAEKIVGARKPARLKDAGYDRNIWQVSVAKDISFEAVQQPDFWAHVARQLKPCDRIEVLAEDMSWFAELLVMDADRLWAKTAVLRFVELAGKEVPAAVASSGFRVEYKGPNKKHVVIRESDNQIVQEGIALKADAERWISEHLTALAR
jgi:hypothetical protein